MGWSRGKDGKGGFEYSLYAGFETLETVGGFVTAAEADRAAEKAERLLMAAGYDAAAYRAMADIKPIEGSLYMSDDELLGELGL